MLGENLNRIRMRRGFSQEELAARIHVVRQTVSKWEKGLSVPDAEALMRLADALEVSVSELLGAEAGEECTANEVAEQLSRINEQMAAKNRSFRSIWRTVVVVIIAFVLLNVIAVVVFNYLPQASVETLESTAVETDLQSVDE